MVRQSHLYQTKNNIMKNIFLITLAIFTLLFTGCDKFEVSNENPDIALNIDRNPELLLTNIQRTTIRRAVSDAWSEGNLMAQYSARIVFTEFDLFAWGDQAGTWNTYFLSIRDAKVLEDIADRTSNNSYKAVSKILQAWMVQILTDVYGDIPYTEAGRANDGIFTPVYDAQEKIYDGLLAELKVANDLLSSSNLPRIKGDLLFSGDLTKWRKFANSLRLRVAMRLSEVKPSLASAVIAEMVNNPTQFPIMQSKADDAAIKFLASLPNAHPISQESVYRVGSYNEYRIAETVENLLRKFNDPRLEFWADPTAASVEAGNPQIAGMQNGIVDGPAYSYKGGDAFLSKFNINFFFFQPNANLGRMMLYSEVAFILAEAAQRGWINIDAKTQYESGVKAAFEHWNVQMPADYLTRNGVAYDGKLETIANQKYLTLFYTDYQGFFEFKRTKFPSTIKPGPDAFFPVYPSRFLYPSKEKALNAENYNAVIARQGVDEITTRLWWEKK